MVRKRVVRKEEKVIEPKPEEHAQPTIVTQIVEVVEGEKPEREVVRETATAPVEEHGKVEPVIEDKEVKEVPPPEKKPEPQQEPETKEPPVAASYEEVVEEDAGEDETPVTEEVSNEDTEKQKQVVEELFTKREPGQLTEIAIDKGKKSSKLFLWAFIVIVAAVTSGVALLAFSGKPAPTLTGVLAKPSPTQTPAPTPVPTVAPTVKREDINIQVLNGGGVPGAAGKMRTVLTDLGYNVSDVGNTEDYSWEETEILVKAGSDQVLKMLEDDLKGKYTIGTASATLPDSVSYDARVIVGQK